MPLIPVGPGTSGTSVTKVSGDYSFHDHVKHRPNDTNKQYLDDICVPKNIFTSSGKCVTNYMCKACGREFLHPSKLKEHYRTHSGERPFKCDFCDSSYAQKNALTTHLRTHTNSRPYSCRFCTSKFDTSSHRTRHEKSVHYDLFTSAGENGVYDTPPVLSPQQSDGGEEYEEINVISDKADEPGCSRQLPEDGDGIKMRVRTMEGNLNAVDEYQEVVFANELPPAIGRRRRADEYKQVVVDSRIYDMAAPRIKNVRKPTTPIRPKRQLAEGVRDQTIDMIVNAVAKGVDPQNVFSRAKRPATVKECEYCGKKLKYPSRIIEHMRTHTKEKPFICPICQTGFAQQTTLRMHLRRHMDTRLFVCPMENCGANFINGALLNLHVKETHQHKRRFCCLNGCGKVFRSNSARSKHELEDCEMVQRVMEEHHTIDQDETLNYDQNSLIQDQQQYSEDDPGIVQVEDNTDNQTEYIIEEWKEDEHGNVIYEDDPQYEDNYYYEEVTGGQLGDGFDYPEELDVETDFEPDVEH